MSVADIWKRKRTRMVERTDKPNAGKKLAGLLVLSLGANPGGHLPGGLQSLRQTRQLPGDVKGTAQQSGEIAPIAASYEDSDDPMKRHQCQSEECVDSSKIKRHQQDQPQQRDVKRKRQQEQIEWRLETVQLTRYPSSNESRQ